MRLFWLIFLCLFVSTRSVFSQSKPSTKIYFYAGGSSLRTDHNPDKPIKISRCTFLETNLDSMGISILPDKMVFIHFEPGQTYFYRIIGGAYTIPTVTTCSKQDFWLNAYFAGVGTYRHYFLDKDAGLRLLEEK